MATVTLYLPKNAKLSVEEGEKVVFGQNILGQTQTTHITYDLIKLLKIKPEDLPQVVKKKEGEKVLKGDILAEKAALFGFLSKKVVVTFNGEVKHVDYEKGEILVSPTMVETLSVVSPVNGKVTKIEKDEMTIDFSGRIVFAKRGLGAMVKGMLSLIRDADGRVELFDIKEEHEGKVLLGGYFPLIVLKKAFGLKAAAVLATSLDEEAFEHLEESKMFDPVLLFIARPDYQVLTQYAGKEVVVEGSHKRILVEL